MRNIDKIKERCIFKGRGGCTKFFVSSSLYLNILLESY